jgi:hypothetical protein
MFLFDFGENSALNSASVSQSQPENIDSKQLLTYINRTIAVYSDGAAKIGILLQCKLKKTHPKKNNILKGKKKKPTDFGETSGMEIFNSKECAVEMSKPQTSR